MRGRVLAAFAVIGLAATLSACTGSSGHPHAGSTAGQHAAAGTGAAYQRIGGQAQGVSLEVPVSWVAVNFSHQTVQQAVGKIGKTGTVETELTQILTPLAQLHAVYAADTNSVKTAPAHYMTNLNAYCASSGITQTGSTGAAITGHAWASQLQQVGAKSLTQTAAKLGKVTGVRSSYTLSTQTAGTLYAVQLGVLPKPGRACFVTLTATGQLPGTVLDRIISTIRYP